jgi:S-adenosylmethionine:tRNA ribosyltransferase-isomerase
MSRAPVPDTRLEAYDYDLPPERVAQAPAGRRDAARLLVLRREGPAGAVEEGEIADLGTHLRSGDLLVLNESRVFPARLRARKPTGGRVDLLLVERDPGDPEGRAWRCLASSGRGLRPGARLEIAAGFEAEFVGEAAGGRVVVRLRATGMPEDEAIERYGVMPVPPYIRRDPGDPREALDRDRYQTVYAAESGSIAAPTAGLHFTRDLLDSLAARGIETARLVLHVGPGTFQPIRAPDVSDHRLEPETFRLPESAARAVAACRARGGRVVAVGTTVTRVLEARAADDGGVRAGAGRCDLYIRPGHRFRAVDALLTNFHLPRSSLLVLVAAFAGRERVLAAYHEAVARGFRFYSYGDAMLIL